MHRSLVAVLCIKVLWMLTGTDAQAQIVPNPGAALPDMVGPVDDSAPEFAEYAASLPPQAPDDIRAIDLSTPVGTLAEAITRAYWFNPQLLAARANLRAADFTLPQARAGYGPSLSYSLSIDWQRDRIESPIGGYFTRSGQTRSAAAILNQPIYTFGRLAAGESAARAQIAFQRATLRDAEQQVLFNAISAYVGLLRDRAGLQIARDNLDILERELSDNQARFNVREATATDLSQVQTRAALARADLLTAQAALDNSDATFRAVIGSPPGELAPPPALDPIAASLPGALELAEIDNPLLAAARAREQASRAAMNGTIAERLPRVDLQGRAEFLPSSPYDNGLRQNSLQGGIVLSGPLFDTGLLSSREAELRASNDADWRLIDSALRDLRAEVRGTWSTRNATGEALIPLGEAVQSAQSAYEGATIQQRAGFRTTLDVLILARDLLSVRNSYNSTITEAYLAQARLLAAMGRLDPGQIVPGMERHDPAAHLQAVDGRGDLPLWTAVLDAIDGLGYPAANSHRPIRDPALEALEPGSAEPES